MSVVVERDSDSGEAIVTFTTSAVGHDHVSVVGSFNGWMPGTNEMISQSDGNLVATIRLPASTEVLHFRYLASDGLWFDDLDAGLLTDEGCVLVLGELIPDSAASDYGVHSDPHPPDSGSPHTFAANDDVEAEGRVL